MQANIKYDFSSKLWKSGGPGGWHFISLPNDLAKEIRENLKWQEEGWGRMKASAMINDLEWDTAIWFDKKADTYLLPVKAEIRNKTRIKSGNVVAVSLLI